MTGCPTIRDVVKHSTVHGTHATIADCQRSTSRFPIRCANMTDLLEKAFAEASKLPQADQDAIAELVLRALRSEEQWDTATQRSQAQLLDLAREALGEHEAGDSKPLDLDSP